LWHNCQQKSTAATAYLVTVTSNKLQLIAGQGRLQKSRKRLNSVTMDSTQHLWFCARWPILWRILLTQNCRILTSLEQRNCIRPAKIWLQQS